MNLTKLTPRASAHLDMIRGLSALAVLFGHVRGLYFIDHRDPSVKCGVFLFGLTFSRVTEAHTDAMRTGLLRLMGPRRLKAVFRVSDSLRDTFGLMARNL